MFIAVITTLIVIGTVVAIIPGVPVIPLVVGVQVVNGALLPVLLVFIWRLAASAEVMGEYRNGRVFNVVAAITVAVTSSLSTLLLIVTFASPFG